MLDGDPEMKDTATRSSRSAQRFRRRSGRFLSTPTRGEEGREEEDRTHWPKHTAPRVHDVQIDTLERRCRSPGRRREVEGERKDEVGKGSRWVLRFVLPRELKAEAVR